MCSLEEDLPVAQKLCIQEKQQICCKCKSESAKVHIRHAYYCQECFLYQTYNKYRGIVGKAGDHNKILIGYSGSTSSKVLLNLIFEPFRKDPNRKVVNEFVLCHVDEGILGQDQVEALANSMNIKSLFVTFNHDAKNNPYLHATKIRNILKTKARELDCKSIYLANSGTSTAVMMMTMICQGRGLALSSDTAVVEEDQDIRILLPLREMLSKEIALYAYFNNIEPCSSLKFTDRIHKLANDFIVGLDKEFPSTVSTMLRTGNKLSCSEEKSSGRKCIQCNRFIEKNSHYWRNLLTVRSFQAETSEEKVGDLCYGCIAE